MAEISSPSACHQVITPNITNIMVYEVCRSVKSSRIFTKQNVNRFALFEIHWPNKPDPKMHCTICWFSAVWPQCPFYDDWQVAVSRPDNRPHSGCISDYFSIQILIQVRRYLCYADNRAVFCLHWLYEKSCNTSILSVMDWLSVRRTGRARDFFPQLLPVRWDC